MTPQQPTAGPPPMPDKSKATPAPPPIPSKIDINPLDVSIENVESTADKLVGKLPQALTIQLIAVVVTVLSGLILPNSVLLTMPFLVMLGFWTASLGWRINQTLPFGRFMLNVFSPMGQFAASLIALGTSPVFLGLISVAPLFQPRFHEAKILVRFLLVGYAVFAIPALIYYRNKALRHLGKEEGGMSMSGKWLMTVMGGIVMILVVVNLLGLGAGEIDSPEGRVKAANQLWESEKRLEAVAQYKLILKEDTYELKRELPAMYRRVIEYEAEYGDPGSARDWCLHAYESSWGPKHLTFESQKATDIWSEVTSNVRRRSSR